MAYIHPHAGPQPSYTKDLSEKRLPNPSHRHAAPSAPWPWIDIHDELDHAQLETMSPPVPDPCTHTSCENCWTGYPQSQFPNWTPGQVLRSKIEGVIRNYDRDIPCRIYRVDVTSGGHFTDVDTLEIRAENIGDMWAEIKETQKLVNNRVRALFLENLSGPVLQMLGTRYNIEPFFWSSSINWIPSRFQENSQVGKGDHVTITLQFLKAMERIKDNTGMANEDEPDDHSTLTEQMIDTQAPLRLHSSKRQLALDLLSVHLIRNVESSVIISYHSTLDYHPSTEAKYLHDRIRFAGQSVYWQKIFQASPDPTFVLLIFVWHTLYAWDEALQDLYNHICYLESRVIRTQDMALTQELHVIRAHGLHYSSLIEDLRKTVKFILQTKNPAMDSYAPSIRRHSEVLMERECKNLLNEIDRLEKERQMQDQRLQNVMHLVFSTVNIHDSKVMQKMTEAAVRDSAAMKQIAYLTMIFLPASFVAAVFGMNVTILVPDTNGTLSHYFIVAVVLTASTIWIIVAFQSRYIYPENTPLWVRLGWPVMLSARLLKSRFGKAEGEIPMYSTNYRG